MRDNDRTVALFASDWGKLHPKFTFTPQMDEGLGQPVEICLRYSAAKYRDFCTPEAFAELCEKVEAKSRGICLVTTDEHLFRRGIVDFAVATQNHNYRATTLVSTLKWVGEEFFRVE